MRQEGGAIASSDHASKGNETRLESTSKLILYSTIKYANEAEPPSNEAEASDRTPRRGGIQHGERQRTARLVAPHRAMAWLRAGSMPTGAARKLWTKSASSSLESANSSVERPIHVSDDMDTERMGMASSGDTSNSP